MKRDYTEEFKSALVGLLLSITNNVNPEENTKYYKFLQKELNISIEEFELLSSTPSSLSQSDSVDIIVNELSYKSHEIMKFLMLLNRCIIIDGCELKSYQKFEEIRDNFLEKIMLKAS
jgi:hypothetical protein